MKNFKVIALMVVLFAAGCKQKPEKLFTAMPSSDTNIEFVNEYEETMELNPFTFDYVYHGAGVAAGDVNNDGLVDLYFSGNTVGNKLYLNKGELAFSDITSESGTAGKNSWATGVTIVDVNGDQWQDIYVCYSGLGTDADLAEILYINQGCEPGGVPTFKNMADDYGLSAPGTLTTHSCFFDYDLDGDLDMFLLNHSLAYRSSPGQAMRNRLMRHPKSGNRLYRNDGNKFSDVSEQAGIYGGWLNIGLSISVSDFNNDMYPDLYVSNDFDEQDYFYVNNGGGTFTQSIEKCFPHISKFSMGSDIADFNNDLLPDVITLDMLPEDNYRQKVLRGSDDFDRYTFLTSRGYHRQHMRNMLHLNRGAMKGELPVFSEIGQFSGVSNTDWSWTALFGDYDNDGNKDLYITNGYLRDLTNLDFQRYDFEAERAKAREAGKDLAGRDGKQHMLNFLKNLGGISGSNYALKNNGDLRFVNETDSWGLNENLISTGAVYADLDNDGDLDLAVNNVNADASIFRNNSEALFKKHFVRIKLKGDTKNTYGLGAKVFIEADGKQQLAECYAGRGFMSSVEPVVHFGLGDSKSVKELKVIWPDSRISILSNIPADTTITISQHAAVKVKSEIPSDTVQAFFEDVTQQLKLPYVHQENAYVDFKYDRLLLYQLSKLGPRLSSGDANGDGIDDFFVGGAADQAGRLFLSTPTGSFKVAPSQPWEDDKVSEDIDSEFFDADSDGDLDLIVISGGVEFREGDNAYTHRIYVNQGNAKFTRAPEPFNLPKSPGTTVATGDYDGDGDADLFIGGGSQPQAYPVSTPSYILRNDSRKNALIFTDVTRQVCPDFPTDGLVMDATWADLDRNGQIELIIAGHCMPITVFTSLRGVFQKIEDSSFNKMNGLWNTVLPIDIDGDSDLDILAGNLGTNAELKASSQYPVEIFVTDIDSNGKVDPIITHYINGVCYPIASRDDLINQIPGMKKKFVRYEPYARASIKEVLDSTDVKRAKRFAITHLSSIAFINNGEAGFTPVNLPATAQFAPIQKFVPVNGDGSQGILIVANLHTYRVEYGPFDASYGDVLTYVNGAFISHSPENLGVLVSGDVRDAIRIDFGEKPAKFIVSKNSDSLQVLMSKQRLYPKK